MVGFKKIEAGLSAPCANPVFFRTYSRRDGDDGYSRESEEQVHDRTLNGIRKVGKLTDAEFELLSEMQRSKKMLPSGRWLWAGGTPWSENQRNLYGLFNCSYNEIYDWRSFGLQMELGMTGCGTGASMEHRCVDQLPPILNKINVQVIGEFGDVPKEDRSELTTLIGGFDSDHHLVVGDSRDGWVQSFEHFLELAADESLSREINLTVDISNIRPEGEKLKGFGGVANPRLLKDLYPELAKITNRAVGRKLTPEEVCLLIDTAARVVVAGSIRRFAGIKLFDADAPVLKMGLWKEVDGVWQIDPDRDALRMSNHTRVFKTKPTLEQLIDAVRIQHSSGEGAIMWAGEAVARANADLLNTPEKRENFLYDYSRGVEFARSYLSSLMGPDADKKELDHRINRHGLNPCFAAGTMILTREGHFPIETLVGKSVEVWDGIQWIQVNNFRVTGENQPVYKVVMHDGSSVVATAYHSFVLEDGTRKELKDLLPGDRLMTHGVETHGIHHEKAAYLKGFLVGDGTAINDATNTSLAVYEPKYCCMKKLIESASEIPAKELAPTGGRFAAITKLGFRPDANRHHMQGLNGLTENLISWVTTNRKKFPMEILNWDLPSKLEFIAGYMDADGTASDTRNGFLYQVSSIHPEWLKGFQILLKTIGVTSHFSCDRKEGLRDFGKNRGGVYFTKSCYRLTIPQTSSKRLSSQVLFYRLQSFADKKVAYKVKPKWNKVASVEYSHVADKVYCCTVPTNHQVSLSTGLITGQCAEIVGGAGFLCNLAEVNLNLIDPLDFEEQEKALKAAAISVASLLHLKFKDARVQQSREWDPIVAVCLTGMFDFFVQAFGVDWLKWWEAGRPDTVQGLEFKSKEQEYLTKWKKIVRDAVWEYCDRHGLKRPNRYTAIQPSGTKSLLTGASPGWHPPKAQRFIRRITFRKNDPVALACLDYGYKIVPSQSDKDENGRLLDDPFDPRCTEWLVEIPVEVPWANLPGADQIDISQFSALAQFNFGMQVQKYYVTHNLSSTIELREHEIEPLAERIYQAIQDDEGYISAALLARFDDKQTFPRLPFEPIGKEQYDQLVQDVLERRTTDDFHAALARHDSGDLIEAGPAGCESDRCLFPVAEGK